MTDHSEHGHENVGHIVPPRILIATGAALLVLTAVTVMAAKVDFSQYDLPEMNIWVAMMIAAVKASLVCLFFMHLRWDRPFNAFVFVSSIVFVAIFVTFAMTDTSEYKDRIDRGEATVPAQKLQQLDQAITGG